MRSKKILSSLAIASLSFLLIGCDTSSEPSVAVTGLTVASETGATTITVGETLRFTATAYPEGASSEVTWSTSDASLATIDDDGLLTALDTGNVYVIATSEEDPTITGQASLIIEEGAVVTVAPTSITLTADTTQIEVGETLSITLSVSPEDASRSVTWVSSETDVATVSNGSVRALSTGTTTITATSTVDTSVSGSIDIEVVEATAPDPTIDWDTIEYTSHAELLAAEDDTAVKVKGVVTFVGTVSDSNLVSYYIQNGDEGFYVYNQNNTYYPVEQGKVYEVGGFKDTYMGVQEIVDVEHFVELEETIEVTTPDISGLTINSVANVQDYMNTYVQINGAVLNDKSSVSSGSSYNVEFVLNDYTFDVRVNTYYLSTEEQTAIAEKFASISQYQEVNLKGVVSAYGYGTPSPQILLMSADDVEPQTATDEQLVTAASQLLSFPYSILPSEDSIELPSSVDGYEDVFITYSSTDETALNSSTGAVTHGTTDTHVTLTATFTLNEASTTAEYEINVLSANDDWLTQVHRLDLEDAEAPGSYGTSPTKSSYAGDSVTLGDSETEWYLNWALIAGVGSSTDLYNGTMSIRTSARSLDDPAYIRNMEDISVDVLEFQVGVYGNDSVGQYIDVKYSTDSGDTWETAYSTTNRYRTLSTTRVEFPETANRISIEFTSNSQIRANVDDIILYTTE